MSGNKYFKKIYYTLNQDKEKESLLYNKNKKIILMKFFKIIFKIFIFKIFYLI